MSEPIKVGDLVMIVRGHECAVRLKGGIPYTVTAIVPQVGGGWYCNACNTKDHAPHDLFGAALWHTGHGNGMPLSWLKRIPPLSELDDVKNDEEITA
jgi:hypothetical protein